MFSLLIADDEALEREGLELMIRHLMPDTFHFLHAENGRKAIQITEEERPDFIFMDIKMPGIQGLEAIRHISAIAPSTQIVMITAHDYFSYAKEGLALGVRDYLLKPARPEEILHVLQLLIAKKEEERRVRHEQLELQEKLSQLIPLAENELSLMLMLESVQEVELEQLASLLDIQWYKGYAMILSFFWKSKKEWDEFQLLKRDIYEAVKHFTKPNLSPIVGPIVGHQMALFVPLPPGGRGYSERITSLEWGERIRGMIEERFQLSLSIGIGSVQEGWDGVSRSYREAVRVCAEDSVLLNVRHYDDMLLSSGQTKISVDDEKKLLDALLRHNKQESAERLNSLYSILEEKSFGSLATLRAEVIGLLMFLCREVQSGEGANLIRSLSVVEDSEVLRKTALYWLDSFIDGLREEREQSRSHVFRRALLYIEQKYKKDISMEHIAECVNLSPHYFSKLFKQHAGETFIDHITGLRIKEAKQLIEQQRLSLKEICYEVGYKDPNYFSRVFKKATGITPSEYRQQIEKKSPC